MIKVNCNDIKGNNSVLLIIWLPSEWESTLIEKNLPFQGQILSFKRRLHFGRASVAKEANRKSPKFFPKA